MTAHAQSQPSMRQLTGGQITSADGKSRPVAGIADAASNNCCAAVAAGRPQAIKLAVSGTLRSLSRNANGGSMAPIEGTADIANVNTQPTRFQPVK